LGTLLPAFTVAGGAKMKRNVTCFAKILRRPAGGGVVRGLDREHDAARDVQSA
jgi:hypothetical protein